MYSAWFCSACLNSYIPFFSFCFCFTLSSFLCLLLFFVLWWRQLENIFLCLFVDFLRWIFIPEEIWLDLCHNFNIQFCKFHCQFIKKDIAFSISVLRLFFNSALLNAFLTVVSVMRSHALQAIHAASKRVAGNP